MHAKEEEMADGRIKVLIDDYERLLKEKTRLKEAAEANEEKIKEMEEILCGAIADAGMVSASDGGYTYTPGVCHKFYLMGAGAAEAAGIDRFAPFENDPALAGLVKKDINFRSMQGALRELEETEAGIPDEVLAVLSVRDEFGITRRKTDTRNIEKVRKAIATRG